MRTRRRVVAAGTVGLLVCAAVVAVIVVRHDASSKTFVCADVGLRGPSADTPEAALDAYVRQGGGDGSEWRRVAHSTIKPDHASGIAPFDSYDFMPKHAGIRPTFSRIIVSNRSRTWSASGACV